MRVVRRSWEGGGTPLWLRIAGPVLALVYGLVSGLRNRLYDWGLLGSVRVEAPVISIGNLVVGGTGKTPLSAWFVAMLADEGWSVALLTRGYGADDEVRLHRRWNPEAAVIVGADRVRGAREAIRGGARILVLDDGFQHRRLARDLDIVLIAGEHPLPARVLPMGPYREPLAGLRRADVVVLTRRTASPDRMAAWRRRIATAAPTALLGIVEFQGHRWVSVDGTPGQAPTGELFAVAGVGQPEAFRVMVEAATGCAVELMAFDDHHAYDAADVDRIRRAAGPRTVVTTEKDAVKLQGIQGLPEELHVLCLDLEWLEGLEAIGARIRSFSEGAPE